MIRSEFPTIESSSPRDEPFCCSGNNDQIDKSATVALFADETGDLGGDATKKVMPDSCIEMDTSDRSI